MFQPMGSIPRSNIQHGCTVADDVTSEGSLQ